MADKNPNKIIEKIQKIQDREAQKRANLVESPPAKPQSPTEIVKLPLWPELARAMPNQVARSSLFAPVARGRRKMHGGTVLVSRADAVLEFWGEQLDEVDADIVLQLMYEARHTPLGQPVNINRAAFLRAIGWGTSGREYKRFHQRMKSITLATLIIEARKPDGSMKYCIGHTKSFRILSDFDYNADTEAYTYTLDPRWAALFGNREYALIDWDKRLQIGRGLDMAKALQRLIATSSDPVQRYELGWLKEKMQYSSPMRKFRQTIIAAAEELRRLEIVKKFHINTNGRGKQQLTIFVSC